MKKVICVARDSHQGAKPKETNMRSSIDCTALAALFASSLVSGAALADDDKVFPGAGCQWESSTTVTNARSLAGLQNTTSSSLLWAVCPVVRDSVEESPEYFSIVTSGTVTGCTLQIRPPDGSALVTAPFGNAFNLGSGRFRYEWYLGDADGPNIPDGAYSLRCRLAPGAFIFQYSVSENE